MRLHMRSDTIRLTTLRKDAFGLACDREQRSCTPLTAAVTFRPAFHCRPTTPKTYRDFINGHTVINDESGDYSGGNEESTLHQSELQRKPLVWIGWIRTPPNSTSKAFVTSPDHTNTTYLPNQYN